MVMNLVDGIIRAENSELSDDEMVDFVQEHQESLLQLQGSWQRLVYSMRECGVIH